MNTDKPIAQRVQDWRLMLSHTRKFELDADMQQLLYDVLDSAQRTIELYERHNKEVAHQKTANEMKPDDYEGADFEGAYDYMILKARMLTFQKP